MDISVVIPIYKNENQLEVLINRIQESLICFDHEVIFVNDCSPDKSKDIILNYSIKYDNIKLIDLDKNIGQQKATLIGLNGAKGDYIAVLDGDLQDSPELIVTLYHQLKSGKNAAFVKRKGMYQSKDRMFTSVLIKRVIQLLSGLHYKAGSYYMFRKSIKERILSVGNRSTYPYMSIVVAHFGGKLTYIDASRGKSIGGSGYTFGRRIKAALMAIYCSLFCTYSKILRRKY